MKNSTLHIILLLTLAVSMSVIGCDKRHEYDKKLIMVDSLLREQPDSALALLETFDSNAFGTEADRAYYALLLTQARYKCYVVATNDSMINTALDYYQKLDDEREKLTRAYIYKGAVMEELGQAEQAMAYYKLGETTVAPDDYFNQGYIKLRLGNIYRDCHIADSSDVMLFKQALNCFKQVPDSFYILTCLTEIGSSYIKTNRDSVLPYIHQAIKLAQELHETYLEQVNQIYVAEYQIFSGNDDSIKNAKRIALNLLNSGQMSDDVEEAMMIVSFALAKENKTDSAQLLLNQAKPYLSSAEDTVFYNSCCAEIARSQGNTDRYQYYSEKNENRSYRILKNDLQRQLRDVESKYDNETLKYEALKYKSNWLLSLLGAALAICALTIVLLMVSHKSARRKRQLQESEDIIERLHHDTERLSTQLQDNQAMNEGLKQTIKNQIDSFIRLVELHYTQFTHAPKKFDELFKKTYSVTQPDKSFWAGIRAYADSTCGGIISHTVANCPKLSETDVRFLSLCCCDLPTTVIMACMGYNEVHSFYNKKRRLCEAMCLDGKLDEYINSFKRQQTTAAKSTENNRDEEILDTR